MLLLEPRDGELRLLARRSLSKTEVTAVALSLDETVALAGSATGELIVASLPGGEKRHALSAHEDAVSAIRSAGNGLWASGDRRGLVRLWRLDGERPHELLALRHPAPVRDLRFLADGVRLFVLLEGEHAVRVHHLDKLRSRLEGLGLGAGLKVIRPLPLPPASEPEPVLFTEKPEGPNGLKLEVFRTPFHQGLHRTTHGHGVEVAWGKSGAAPSTPSPFSSRLSGWLRAPRPGRYRLALGGESIARLWLDGVLILETVGAPFPAEVELTDRPHDLRIEQTTWGGQGWARLTWGPSGASHTEAVALPFLFSDRKSADAASGAPGR